MKCNNITTDPNDSKATPPEKLTMRLAVLEISNQITVPVGLSLGAIIFTASRNSYTTAYIVSMAVSAFGLLYALLFVNNLPRHNNAPKPISWDDLQLLSALKATCRHREDNSRQAILLLLAMIFFHSMMLADNSLLYLCGQLKFKWDTTSFSKILTTESLFSTLVVAFIIPTVHKNPQISDTHVLTCGVLLVIISRFCYAFAEHEWAMYLGAAASGFQALILVSIRSMISKIPTSEERGKVLSMYTSIESGAGLVSSPLYAQVYSATVATFPSSIYFVSICLQSCILIFIPILSSSLSQQSKDENNECKLIKIKALPNHGE